MGRLTAQSMRSFVQQLRIPATRALVGQLGLSLLKLPIGHYLAPGRGHCWLDIRRQRPRYRLERPLLLCPLTDSSVRDLEYGCRDHYMATKEI